MSLKRAIWGLVAALLLGCVSEGNATTRRYRLSYRDNPATTIVIGWDQQSGSNPQVFYDTVDHGTNHSLYSLVANPGRIVPHKGMSNHFVRLTGLTPNTAYYFLIRDSDGNSDRYWFSTLPDNPGERLSIVAGGDSRSNQSARVRGNEMVAKLRPHMVLFGGDYTFANTSLEWATWMDNWQSSIAPDGRMTPIVGAQGNHESGPTDVYNLFDVPSPDAYYALTFGGSLLRAYTLNSEISQTGSQVAWLANDLQINENTTLWKFAQYHRPCRPHYSGKSDQNNIYNLWVPEFEDHGVNLVVECDAHVVKRTYPILKGLSGPTYDEGFYRDDAQGIVYVGEGTWAPLRTADDGKAWTRDMGSLNSFKWIWVDQCEVQLRTIGTDNVGAITALTDANRFSFPANLEIWSPANGPTVVIPNPACGLDIFIASPMDGSLFGAPQTIPLNVVATDAAPGTVSQVEFFANGVSIGTDNTAPYSLNWTIPSNGNYALVAVATDNDGFQKSSDLSTIQVGNITVSSQVNSSSDDAEEAASGVMYLTSSDLEMVYDGSNQLIGVRFNNLGIPVNAAIDTAYIQFTVDETTSAPASLTIRGEAEDNPPTFSAGFNNISSRSTTFSSVTWNPLAWATVGDRGIDQRTPGLNDIVEEIVARPGWASGNSMVFVVSGSGERVAEAYDGVSAYAPQLVIQYSITGAVSLEDLPESVGILMGPVPARRFVNVDLGQTTSDPVTFSLWSLNGKRSKVHAQSVVPGRKYRLNLKRVPAGVHWVEIERAGEVFYKKLVVQ